ncbi:low temperature requirement protein A [Rhodococcus spelaei]|nr:low temperature requirement protein A [Rhodococcus spelaei]
MSIFGRRLSVEVPASRVTNLELFFDLVFVFTITQLTALLEHELSIAGALRVLLVFAALWWMYGGYAWLTNQVPPTTPRRQLPMLVAMAGFLICAISVPSVFDGSGIAFGIGYLIVVCVHLVMLNQSSTRKGVLRLAPFNLVSALLILVAGFVDGVPMYVLWVVAIAIQMITPYLGVAPQFELNAEHFVERHGLLIIVALGESVIAIGLSAQTDNVSAGLAAVVVLALALPAALWWTYFSSGDDLKAEHALATAEPGPRALLAIRGYFYAHIPMLIGILAIAVGMHQIIAHPTARLGAAGSVALATGVALFYLGDAEFRRVLQIGPSRVRVLVAVAGLATIPLGLFVAGWVQLAAAVAVVSAPLVVEQMRRTTASGWGRLQETH